MIMAWRMMRGAIEDKENHLHKKENSNYRLRQKIGSSDSLKNEALSVKDLSSIV